MAKGYWMVRVNVNDAENYPDYLAAGAPVYEKWGAKFLVRGGNHEVVEGKSRERHVIVEFESYEKALACYHSDEYQAAARIRQACGETDFVIIKGH